MASYRDRLPASGSARVVSVQRLTTLPTNAGITDITISPVIMANTRLVVSYSYRDGGTPLDMLCSVSLISSSTIRVTRLSGASSKSTNTPFISIEVVTDSSTTVQRGSASTFGNIAIPTAVDVSKSTASVIGWTCNNAYPGAVGYFIIAAQLASSSSISLTAFNTSNVSNISWEVVSYA